MSALKRLPLGQGRPTPQEVKAVIESLAARHGKPNRHQHSAGLQVGCELKEPHTVLDSLVRTILSQNTTDITSQRAYTSLKQAFPNWELVRTAPPGAVEDAIRVGGLADIKASRIKAILESLLSERGELSLEHLRHLPGDEVKAQLVKYKGVGPKSIACVMLFCLGRDECPVDTHVWEISKQLGWVPGTASREATYEYLNAVVPDEHKYELHVLLVEHGKVCPHCFKRSKVGDKRKGKSSAAAAAEPCPLATFKRGSFSSSSLAAVQDSSSWDRRSVAEAVGDVSDVHGMAAGVVVKTEPLDSSGAAAVAAAAEVLVKTVQGGCGVVQGVVAVKVEQQQEHNHVEAAAAVAIKQEPQQQLEAIEAEPAAAVQRTRKRTKRG